MFVKKNIELDCAINWENKELKIKLLDINVNFATCCEGHEGFDDKSEHLEDMTKLQE